MKKTTVAMAIIIVVALIGAMYIFGDKVAKASYMTKPALKITVKTDIDTSKNDLIQITNMSFEQQNVPTFYRSADSPAKFPDIDVEAKSNFTSAPVSYWVSFERVSSTNTYEFLLTFRDPYVPKTGDLLILTIRMNDFRGNLEYKATAFYEWK